MLDGPYVQVALQAPPSPDYIPGPEEPQSPPLPDFVLEPVYPEYMPQEDEVFPAEEQPLPATASPTTQSPDYVLESDPEADLEEDDDDDPEEDPVDYPADGGDDGDDEYDEDDDERDRPMVTLPLVRRLGIALRSYHTRSGESSYAAAAETAGGPLGQSIGDRRVHARTARLMKTEARMSREAWGRSMDASDLARAEVMSLHHRRQKQLTEALKLIKRLQTQMTEFERQQGPAKGPAQPELPEEAGSSS
ncbi:hypothetical protein Tco_1028404 [Tanacetum coccineum]|uniref:Uncharacterized protein n=1 Tax=Tanacetum coccineum TaxID=301880 RepID=A0ABQ5G0J3_9ASTR